jgi:electron transport complex protein RnfG
MNSLGMNVVKIGLMLAVFAIVATTLVTYTEQSTRDKIAENERQTLLAAINAVVDSKTYNNAILTDTVMIKPNSMLNTSQPTVIYRARMNGNPVAAVFTSIAPNGYNGKIQLLVGVNYDGAITGVRVISHKETPGLGDKIELTKTNWILSFNDVSLSNPAKSKWKVQKDGGQFDQFTGATITPRAIVAAVKRSLEYFNDNREQLFEETINE